MVIKFARKLVASLVFVSLVALGFSGRSEASFLTYTETGKGNLTLGATTYTNVLFTISGTGDTSLISSPQSGLFGLSLVGQVAIAGVATATITDDFLVFVNQTTGVGGFADTTVRRDTLDISNTTFHTYDLASTLGPIGGPAVLYDPGLTNPIETTAGQFRINQQPTGVTFTVTTAVPEPSSLVLCGIAASLGIVGSRLRIRSNRAQRID